MCARILKATNSSFCGLRSKVTSIDRAVPLIGTTVVTSLALSFSLAEETMQSGAIAEHYFTYWRQSIVQASAAELLCRGKAKSKKNEYFLAGLLTDLGRLAMLKTVPQEYLPVLARSIGEQSSLRLLEAEMLGVDHVEVGTKLMEEWGLPERLIKSVSCHHNSPDRLADERARPDFDLVQAVAIASSVGEFFCSPAKGPKLQR